MAAVLPGAAVITATYEGFTDSVPMVVVGSAMQPTPFLEIIGTVPRQPGQVIDARAQLRTGPVGQTASQRVFVETYG